jgi:FixJ family two-component response regulator
MKEDHSEPLGTDSESVAFPEIRMNALADNLQHDRAVFVVDDDVQIVHAISRQLRGTGHNVRSFTSAADFLAAYDPAPLGCLILDLSMPGMDGLELQALLSDKGVTRPIIFLAGPEDIRKTVAAMKSGAADFLVKPVRKDELLSAVTAAIEQDIASRERNAELTLVNERLGSLTARQREVLLHVVTGRMNKQIASELGTAEKTIKVHRARMMVKMGVRTVAELVRLVERVGIHPEF